MRTIDTSIYSAEKSSRIKPDVIDLSGLPPIQKPTPLPNLPVEVVIPPPQARPESSPETERNSVRNNERTEKRSENRSELRTKNRTVLPVKRQTKRYSFEFYVDQLARLKRLKHRVEDEGDNISLSDIVRQAVDNYLTEQGE